MSNYTFIRKWHKKWYLAFFKQPFSATCTYYVRCDNDAEVKRNSC